MTDALRYRRVLLKLSGEALLGGRDFGIDPDMVNRLAGEIDAIRKLGVQVGVVVGGGNIFRGIEVARASALRIRTADIPAPSQTNAISLGLRRQSGPHPWVERYRAARATRA